MSKVKPHTITGLIKFTTTHDEFTRLSDALLKEIARNPKRLKIDFDQIVVIGTVAGENIFEIRFIKFLDDEQ